MEAPDLRAVDERLRRRGLSAPLVSRVLEDRVYSVRRGGPGLVLCEGDVEGLSLLEVGLLGAIEDPETDDWAVGGQVPSEARDVAVRLACGTTVQAQLAGGAFLAVGRGALEGAVTEFGMPRGRTEAIAVSPLAAESDSPLAPVKLLEVAVGEAVFSVWDAPTGMTVRHGVEEVAFPPYGGFAVISGEDGWMAIAGELEPEDAEVRIPGVDGTGLPAISGWGAWLAVVREPPARSAIERVSRTGEVRRVPLRLPLDR